MSLIRLSICGGLVFFSITSSLHAEWPCLFGCPKRCCSEQCCPSDYQQYGYCWECCQKECCSKCKRHKFLKRILPGEPPRGEIAVSIAGRINNESFREIAEELQKELQKECNDQETQEEIGEAQLDTIEEDLTRLTIIVNGMAKAHKESQEDLTRMSIIVDELAKKHIAEAEEAGEAEPPAGLPATDPWKN